MVKRVFQLLTTGALWGQVDTRVNIRALQDQAGPVIPSAGVATANGAAQVSKILKPLPECSLIACVRGSRLLNATSSCHYRKS